MPQMPIDACLLNLDRGQRELSPHGTASFPCAAYAENYARGADFPWHWHGEIEVIYVAAGGMKVMVPGKSFGLKKGDSVFINSGILHYGRAEKRTEIKSLVFSPMLVSGSPDSAIDAKYVQPLIGCVSLDGLICPAEESQKGIGMHIVSAFRALRDDVPGAELIVREHLSRIILIIYNKYYNEIAEHAGGHNVDSERVRKMIAYIERNFAGPLALSDIAAAAGVGERECLRCFKRTIQIPPLQYAMRCRLEQSAAMLGGDSSTEIADIALDCGFASPASFAQLFRRYYGCTPREYRNRRVRGEPGRLRLSAL